MVEKDIKTMREMDVEEKTIRFSIKANDTESNQSIHDGFKDFCRIECDNNYTLGLKRLLENYEHSDHIEALWSKLSELEANISQMKPKKEEKKEEGMF